VPKPDIDRSPDGSPVPAVPDLSYSNQDWDDECVYLFAEGRDPAPCPACGRTGFYGPRVAGKNRRYRECRFCGLYQAVGEPAQRALPTAHGCDTWPEIAKAPYIWWLVPGTEGYECPFCGARATLAEDRVSNPAEDSEHPWHRVPQGRNRFYYARFWENWAYTKGRVVL
jgi:hypothetical protein